jgi:hypothetical protein
MSGNKPASTHPDSTNPAVHLGPYRSTELGENTFAETQAIRILNQLDPAGWKVQSGYVVYQGSMYIAVSQNNVRFTSGGDTKWNSHDPDVAQATMAFCARVKQAATKTIRTDLEKLNA